MEFEKLAQEKTEMQRHYVMVSCIMLRFDLRCSSGVTYVIEVIQCVLCHS